ncbi:hypothetical protein FKM82_009986 [Ascaphus truei]
MPLGGLLYLCHLRVEQASEFAVSEVFSRKKSAQRGRRPPAPALDLESTDQLHDHDDAFAEAQDLLSEWMNTKLKLELASDDEDEAENVPAELTAPKQPPPEFVKYNRFDDLYDYLEQETERTTAQEFLQQLLQKEVVDSGILEGLRSDNSNPAKKQRDPRLTMELRHQQVKENRAKRQKALENQRQERALKKSALSQAQLLVQEETKKKGLKTKKDEEDIQREVVKLRKEMSERRKVMGEARKIEWKRQEMEKARKPTERILPQTDGQEEERGRQARIQERLSQVYAENHKCLQKYFSAWYKTILERRMKMGKARALSDWKHQLLVFRAWRDHLWSRKLERETQKMEMDLRDQNRKQQLALESDRRRLLRLCLVEWQHWSRAEKEKRELEAQKEETKRKMAALLDAAVSLGAPKETGKDQREVGSPPSREQRVEGGGAVDVRSHAPVALDRNTHVHPPKVPKHAWQVTRQHAALTSTELAQHRLLASNVTDGRHSGARKRTPPYGENFENRNVFQQQLIDEQKRQLQEQKEMILGLMENQRLMISKQEAKRASAVTAELSNHAPHHKQMCSKGSDRVTEGPSAAKHAGAPSSPFPLVRLESRDSSPSQSTVSTNRRPAGHMPTPHPVVKAMEERAAQRAERKKELEEMRRKREDDKLVRIHMGDVGKTLRTVTLKRVILTAFRTWRHFPLFMRDLKLKEERRELLRKKVAEILPDFRM